MNVQMILSAKGQRVVRTTPETPVRHAVQTLKRERIGAIVVSGANDEVQGILSERDVVYALAEGAAGDLSMPVSALMTADVVCCTPDQDLENVMGLMTSRRIRHLPVVENGALVGIVSIGDLVKHRLDELRSERDSLRQYIATA